MPLTMDAAIDQLNRVYRYTGAVFYAALFTDGTTNQQVSGVNITTDTFTSSAHNLVDGCRVRFVSNGALPAPLVANTTYYVVNVASDTFRISLVKGGNAIDITTAGSGGLTVIEQTPDPKLDSLNIWTRLESDYFGSGRQLLSFAAATPDPERNRALMAEVIATFTPTGGSITYRYFGVIADGQATRGSTAGRLHFIQDFGTTQTIVQGNALNYKFGPTALLGV